MPNKAASAAPVFLIERDGRVTRFESKTHILQDLGWGWIANNVGERFTPAEHGPRRTAESSCETRDFILRTGSGVALTALDLPSPYARWRRLLNSAVPRPFDWKASDYAGVPVPGSAKRRGGSGYYRRPATTGERRMNVNVAPDEEPRARAARCAAQLPNSYDDIHRSDAGVQNWKRYRRTQWKARP